MSEEEQAAGVAEAAKIASAAAATASEAARIAAVTAKDTARLLSEAVSHSKDMLTRDALRADLGDLREELKYYFDTKIELKANVDHVDRMDQRIIKQEAGEFTAPQVLRIQSIVTDHIKTGITSTWALRTNKMAWVVGFLAFASLAVSIISLIHAFT